MLGCLVLGALLSQGQGAFDGRVRSVELESRPGTSVQHFRIDHEPKRGPAAVGVARYLSAALPAGGLYVELDLHYFAEDVRVIHVEQSSGVSRSLVFREVDPFLGRTLFLEANGTSCAGYELGGGEVLRHEFPLEGEFPLLLIESLRRGGTPRADAAVLDPLSARCEPTRFELRERDGERSCEARRGDESLRWRIEFGGSELRAWRFQDHGPLARAIPRDEYERLEERFALDSRAAREAAARAIRAPQASGRKLRTLVAPLAPAR